MIRVVTVRVGEEPKVDWLAGDLESMQAFVGGSIDMVAIVDGVDLVCNDEGVLLDLPENGCGIRGPYFFAGTNEEGDTISLTDEQCQISLTYATVNRRVRHPGGGPSVEVFDTWDEMMRAMEQRKFDEEHRN